MNSQLLSLSISTTGKTYFKVLGSVKLVQRLEHFGRRNFPLHCPHPPGGMEVLGQSPGHSRAVSLAVGAFYGAPSP